MHDHDSDIDDLDFAMPTPPTRHGPCKAEAAPEVDPVERRLEREREAAPFRDTFAEALFASGLVPPMAVEVKHGSGKVKV